MKSRARVTPEAFLRSYEAAMKGQINRRRELNEKAASTMLGALRGAEYMGEAEERARAILERICRTPDAPANKDLDLRERVRRLEQIKRSRAAARRKDRVALFALLDELRPLLAPSVAGRIALKISAIQ